MKVHVKKKYSSRYNIDGSLKEVDEYQELTDIEEKFRARVSMQQTFPSHHPHESSVNSFSLYAIPILPSSIGPPHPQLLPPFLTVFQFCMQHDFCLNGERKRPTVIPSFLT